jgi:hypothetical protein
MFHDSNPHLQHIQLSSSAKSGELDGAIGEANGDPGSTLNLEPTSSTFFEWL